jgi:nicotinamidase-related amidase
MSAADLLSRDRTALLVVDVQEAFRKAVPGFDRIAEATATLVRGAVEMGVPVICTEQYPKGLGETVAEVSSVLPPDASPLEKTRFSATGAEGFDLSGRDQVVLCGVESHVCVAQTAVDLLSNGLDVRVVEDAVGSRSAADREVGLRRMTEAGAVASSVEASMFELLGEAGTPEFKSVQKMILEFAPGA